MFNELILLGLLFRKTYLVVAAANGVVIATEKKLPSILVDEASVSEIVNTLLFLYTEFHQFWY